MPFLDFGFVDRLPLEVPDIVDKNIEPPKVSGDALDQCFNPVRIGDVGRDCPAFGAAAADRRHDLLGANFVGAVAHRHPGAGATKRECHFLPDAPGRPRHQGYSTL